MLLIDPASGNIIDANNAASQFYGYTHKQLLSMSIQQINILTPAEVAEERRLAAQENRNFFIFRHRLKDGQTRTVTVRSHPYDFNERKLLFSIINDISRQRELMDELWHYQTRLEEMNERQSEDINRTHQQTILALSACGWALVILIILLFYSLRKSREAERALNITVSVLQDAKNEAEEANLSKSKFLASMSHELRTPLNAILGFAQFMQFDPGHPLSKAQNEHVNHILEGGNHLLELVDEVLDLSKIEAHHLDLSIEEVDAKDVIADCLALSVPLAKHRNISITNACNGKSLPLIQTDRMRLKQCLLNFLSNAVKYNKHGGTITVKAKKTNDGFLKISITDTGLGIPMIEHDSVFQMFYRLDDDPLRAREGTGIGLTVTKLIAERMAGRVSFDSIEGVGSTFWIELPLASNTKVLIWTDTMLTGIDALDKDHQVIVSLINSRP
ncbi:MAG: PAS domain S-box protein [Rhodospirillales bacterium]|nr:PAS domain S-box protein [Rhodospirillales bacterium]